MSKGKKAVRSHAVRNSNYALGWSEGFRRGMARNEAIPLGCKLNKDFATGFDAGLKAGRLQRRREAAKVRSAFALAQGT